MVRGTSLLAIGAVLAFAPVSPVFAAPITWSGATDNVISDPTNWVGGNVPVDGDTITFDDSNDGTTASLTGTLVGRPNGIDAGGSSGTAYNFTIANLTVQAGAVLSSDTANKVVTVSSLDALGDLTINRVAVTAATVDGDITISNVSGLDQDDLAAWEQTAGNQIILGASTNVALTADTLGDEYTIVVGTGANLTLTQGVTYTTPIIMDGGFLTVADAPGTATVSELSLTDDSKYNILNVDGLLLVNEYTPGAFSFTAHDSNLGTFVPVTTVGGGSGDGDGDGTGTGGTGTGSTGGDTDTDTPGAPNTAFSLILSNPFMIIAATIAVAGGSFALLKLRNQSNR